MRCFRYAPYLLTLTVAVALSAAPGSAFAQSTFAGTWLLRYERAASGQHASSVNASASPAVEVVQGRLTLRQSGDSLFCEWHMLPAKGDSALPPRSVHGVQRRDSAFLRLIPAVDTTAGIIANAAHEVVVFLRTYIHGMPPTTTAFDLGIRGDVLSGMRRTVLLDGTPRGNESMLTGVRTKP